MNKEWAEMNKEMQLLLKKEATFKEGITKLIELRTDLFQQITNIVNGFPEEAFSRIPFAGAKGFHCKTLSYSIWHIFRIEDIVAHEMIEARVMSNYGDHADTTSCREKYQHNENCHNKENYKENEINIVIRNEENWPMYGTQVLYTNDWLTLIGSPIITTGNEVRNEELEEFSQKLQVQYLYEYAKAVFESSNELLNRLTFSDLKIKFDDTDKEKLHKTGSVSEDPEAVWLIDYWCGKSVGGLLQMPFSRHWIMHIEAMQRIKNRLCKLERKGVDPIAYCGFSCNHCFLGEWCGSCRTNYNVCSFATCSPDGKCPNVVCCQEKEIDGCYECDNLRNCTRGFYTPENDGANAAKAQALFISKYGKKVFLKTHDKLHEKYDFAKTQEILGQDIDEGLKILEDNR